MKNTHGNGCTINSPLVIGGVGGSGTRVVAEIMTLAGIHLGYSLNPASDNLSFTLIFKRNKWLFKVLKNGLPLDRYIALHEALLLNKPLSLSEKTTLLKVLFSWAQRGETTLGLGRHWARRFVTEQLMAQTKKPEVSGRWGWKEPNSHILLHQLFDYYPEMKYVHTIRHGLDMSLSENQQQLLNWGAMWGVETRCSPSEIRQRSLEYWLIANERVVEFQKLYGQDRVLIINYDELCSDPVEPIKNLLAFADVDVSDGCFASMVTLPKAPSSLGRYKSTDLSSYDNDSLKRVRQLGFQI